MHRDYPARYRMSIEQHATIVYMFVLLARLMFDDSDDRFESVSKIIETMNHGLRYRAS